MAIAIRAQGAWQTRPVGGLPGFDQALFSDWPGSALDIHAQAPRLELSLLHHPWSGVVELEIDGRSRHTIELYSPELTSVTYRIELPGPAAQEHRLCLRLLDARHAHARGQEVYVGAVATAADAGREPAVRQLTEEILWRRGQEGDFLVFARDTAVSRGILHAGVWAASDVALFRKFIRPGDTVFDIGANLGHHSVVYSRAVGPGGRVFCFEPQQYIFNALCANLLLNRCANAHPQRLALGQERGKVRMLPTDYGRDDNFAAVGISTRKELQFETAELVPIATVDDFVTEHGLDRLDFMKIDVQTLELFVLRGAVRSLERFRPRLFVEIAPYWMKRVNDYDYREVYDLLRDLGYTVLDKDLRPAPVREAAFDPGEEWDVVALAESDVLLGGLPTTGSRVKRPA